jgi:hypothetical protein
MIIAVEGVSAAGKTTWCQRHAPAGAWLPEYFGQKPPDDPAAAAQFWADVNCRQWATAIELEQTHGIAYCDTDPVKLHYTWCVMHFGQATPDDWREKVRATRCAFERNTLGFSDRIAFLDPDEATIRRQKELDATRRRHNFDVHIQLAPLLRTWYQTLDQLSPGRVIWHAERLTTPIALEPSRDRYSLALFDELIARLPTR